MKYLITLILLCASLASAQDLSNEQIQFLNGVQAKLNNIQPGNKIYLDSPQASGNSGVTITQTGTTNNVGSSLEPSLVIDTGNTIKIKQGSTSGKSLSEISVTGPGNTIDIEQAYNQQLPNPSDTGYNYAKATVTGSTNSVSVKQSSETAQTNKSAVVTITGYSNLAAVNQSGSGEKSYFMNISGNQNITNVFQTDSGNQTVDVSVIGNINTAQVFQFGSGNHKATVSAINAGGASNVLLLQQGSTPQSASIQQSCANLAGCSVTVVQGP